MVYDCIIIGSGVAGLTAGLYLGRASKTVMIIENGVLGGNTALIDKIDNYPGIDNISGFDLINRLVTQVSNVGVSVDFFDIISIDFDNNIIHCSNIDIEYKTLIIASGTSYNKLGCLGENDFKYRGVSYCAICDGALYRNKELVIITNGNTASQDIEYLKNISKNINVLDLSSACSISDINVIHNAKILSINGDKKVESITFDSEKGMQTINCDGVFIDIGRNSDTSLYASKIRCQDMHILTDDDMHTNVSNVFACGDIRVKKLRQIVTACSDGAIAATEVIKYLNNIKN